MNGGLSKIRSLLYKRTILSTGCFILNAIIVIPHYFCSAKTEFAEYGKPAIYGETMPYAMTQHCIVRLSQTSVLFIGGKGTKSTYFYDIATRIWSEGPELPDVRLGHSCGVFQNSAKNEESLVVMTGGSDGKNHWFNSTLLLDLSNPNLGWIHGPDLPSEYPFPVFGGTMVSLGTEFCKVLGTYSVKTVLYRKETKRFT